MSDSSKPVPPEFQALEVPPTLGAILARVREGVLARKDRANDRLWLKAGWLATVPITFIWMVGLTFFRLYTGSFGFIDGTLCWGSCATIVLGGVAYFLQTERDLQVRNGHYDGSPPVYGWMPNVAWALTGLVGLLSSLPVFPIPWMVAVSIMTYKVLSHPVWDRGHRPFEFRDSRWRDFERLTNFLDLWEQTSEYASQLRLQLGHNMIKNAGERDRTEKLLRDLETDEAELRDRIAYCADLAKQGKLGTHTVREDMGAELIQRLEKDFRDFRKRSEQAREFAARAVAANEVRKLGTV